MDSPYKVLMIEDNDDFAVLIQDRIGFDDHSRLIFSRADRLDEGLRSLADGDFDVILLDLGLPDSEGLATFERIHQKAPETPIVVLSALGDATMAVDAVRRGAQDYLVKSKADGESILRAVRYAVERQRILEKWKAEWQLTSLQAVHDPLTKLPNRLLLQDRLQQGIARAARSKTQMGVLFLDLDDFKIINDRFGHQSGDQLLEEVAQRLRESMRAEDTVARLGGDEFVILMHGLHHPFDAQIVADRIQAGMAKSFVLGKEEVRVGASIGISLYPSDGDKPAALLDRADRAMYEAKSRGPGNIGFYRDLPSARRETH